MATRWVSVNSLVTPDYEARIDPFDHAVLTGDGVFETLRIYGQTAFAITRHLARLRYSAAAMNLEVPDDETLRSTIAEVIEANGIEHGRLRITLTGGPGPLGSARGAAGPTVIVAAEAMKPWPPTTNVVTVPWPRNERGALAGVKSTSYGENVIAWNYAAQRDAGEAVFANTVGNLCEGTGSNVFLALDGELITPPTTSGCLAGVTRDLIIELTGATERDCSLEQLALADEAFLTSTTREVQPIAEVDGTKLPAAPGPLATAAQAAFTRLLQTTLDPT